MGIEEKWVRKGQTSVFSSVEEWGHAKQVMQSMLDAGLTPPFKINKDTHNLSHSFVVSSSHNHKPLLGVVAHTDTDEGIIDFGNFGMCKVILWEDGRKSAVKIEPDGGDHNEILIMEKLGLIQVLFKREWDKRVHEKAELGKEPNTQWIRTKSITDKIYKVMPLIEGIDLNNYLSSNDSKHSMQTQRLVAISIVHRLQELHAMGIIHNDLHTNNVMLDADLNAYLIDYGKSVDLAHKPTSVVDINRRFGRNDTLAPEVAVFKSELAAGLRFDPEGTLAATYDMPVTPASDIYSLGQLLFKLFQPVAMKPEMEYLILNTLKSNVEERMPLARVLETLESPAFIEMTQHYDETIAETATMSSDELSSESASSIPSEVVGSNISEEDYPSHEDTHDPYSDNDDPYDFPTNKFR